MLFKGDAKDSWVRLADKAFAELAKQEVGKKEIAFVFHELSTLIVKAGRYVLIIDPADFFSPKDVAALGKVDAILITHEHYDHFNASKTLELQKATGAAVVCNPGAQASLTGKIPKEKLKVLRAGETVKLNGIRVTAVESVHPGEEPLMFLVEVNGSRFFHGSDSGYSPAIEKHKGQARVAFLPVGTPSPTASVSDAIKMALSLGCERAIPIHGSSEEVSNFEKRLSKEMPKVQVIIPEASKVYKV